MTRLTFTTIGRPQPAGSKKAFVIRRDGRPTGRAAVVDDNKRSKPWQAAVATAAAEALTPDPDIFGGGPDLLEGPLVLTVDFYLQRPKGHFRTGRNARLLRDDAPAFPAVQPDTTKLVRAIEDALTGVAWRDDAQVVVQTARKLYGTPERAEITIDAVTADAPPDRAAGAVARLFTEVGTD